MLTANGLACLHSCFTDPEVVMWRWLNIFQGNLNVAEELYLVYSGDAFPWRSEAAGVTGMKTASPILMPPTEVLLPLFYLLSQIPNFTECYRKQS